MYCLDYGIFELVMYELHYSTDLKQKLIIQLIINHYTQMFNN